HPAQLGPAAERHGTPRPRGRGPARGEGRMTESPVPALRAQFEVIARKLNSCTGVTERETIKREIIGYFKQVDVLITELSELKEQIRTLVDRYKQVMTSTAEASAPEFT